MQLKKVQLSPAGRGRIWVGSDVCVCSSEQPQSVMAPGGTPVLVTEDEEVMFTVLEEVFLNGAPLPLSVILGERI